ncbi:MAG: hypothetical protein IT199_06940, partial [Solirubrobacterales bacterium]|nr:hypothetical protein [Solirubrobacterales bacterium]
MFLWIKRNKVGAISFACFLVALLLYCQPFFSLSFGNHPLNSTFPSHDEGAEMPGQAVVPAAAAATANLGGYASKVSLKPGESINFHISTDWATPYNLTIWREGATRTLMTTLNNVAPVPYNCANGYATGCNWPVARQFAIPGDWPSGVYGVDIPTVTAGTQHIIFIVRAAQPGATSKILSLSSVNTWQAYNNYGGKSLYDDGSSDGIRSPRVSLNRPYEGWGGYGEFPRWEGKYVRWMEEEGYPIEYATTYDLESVPTLLDGYDVVVIVGHSEYWTWNARQRLKQFIANGGRFINFSGNTMWWQVRFEDNGRTMVGYKDYIGDPIKAPELSTDNPWDRPIFDSPYPLTGAHWTQGGYPFSANLAFEQGYGGYKVQQADHWVFANTGLTDQSMVGRNSTKATTILDHEVDGSSFNCTVDGYTVLSPLANTGVAENFTILGIAPAYVSYLGFGVMGIYTNEQGGATFSTNTTGWANGLGVDPQISQITRNVLDRFLDQTTPMP